MTTQEIKNTVLRTLARIAPEADLTSLRGDVPLRSELDIDSIDFLNFVIELHREFGVEVPETDYNALSTLDGVVAYFESRVARPA
jgi:acyl carrier protein